MTENGASYLADVGTAFGNDYVRPLQCITPGSWETWCERIPRGMMNRSWLLATDNGSSFIARRFVDFIGDQYSHVRIQYRTPQQLGLLERFHRTLKTEEVYWRLYNNPQHARECLTEFQVRYNTLRPHWALLPELGGDPLVSADVYSGGEVIQIPRWQGWAARLARS